MDDHKIGRGRKKKKKHLKGCKGGYLIFFNFFENNG
jgi:hypothetical protein